MKAYTLTQIGNTKGTGLYQIFDIDYLGLLYNKRNYEFKMKRHNSDDFFIVRSNGPAIHRMYIEKKEIIDVELHPYKVGFYLDYPKNNTKNNTKKDNKNEDHLEPESFINFLESFNIGISYYSSNENSLVLTSLPSENYNDGYKALEKIYNYVKKQQT